MQDRGAAGAVGAAQAAGAGRAQHVHGLDAHDCRGVRALPLAPAEDVAPRSLEWTEAGLWLQPKYGCVFLESE